ncbi:MAG: hypothetical protein ACJ776_08580 [Chloroflexota bacterium]
MVIAAAICSILLGLGFGIPAIAGAVHFAQTGEIWMLLGLPTYGGGPFERLGLPTSVPLLVGFALVCLAEVAVGMMLLLDVPHAVTIAYLLLPLELVFWVGFALPFGAPLGITRTILLLLA